MRTIAYLNYNVFNRTASTIEEERGDHIDGFHNRSVSFLFFVFWKYKSDKPFNDFKIVT